MAIHLGDPIFSFNARAVAIVPAASGVYALCNAQGNYLYFGESSDIQGRLSQHLIDNRFGATLFAYELHPTEAARVARRNRLIVAYPTPWNQRLG